MMYLSNSYFIEGKEMLKVMSSKRTNLKYQLNVTIFCQSHGGKEESDVFNV